MTALLSNEVFMTRGGRRRAWQSLLLDDHGLLRQIYDNSHPVGGSGQMWRTYQPSPKDIGRWADLGIKTVINLRGYLAKTEGRQPGFYWLEKEACERHGLALENFRAFSRQAPKPEFISGINALFNRITYPAVLHCKSGSDRAGIASALYLFLKENLPLDEAIAQLSFRYGHLKAGRTKILDHFFTVYRQAARRDGVIANRAHFLTWVACEYDPEEMNYTFKADIFGSLLTEKILQRE
jgi:protein tyrosine/serine phosphatase